MKPNDSNDHAADAEMHRMLRMSLHEIYDELYLQAEAERERILSWKLDSRSEILALIGLEQSGINNRRGYRILKRQQPPLVADPDHGVSQALP